MSAGITFKVADVRPSPVTLRGAGEHYLHRTDAWENENCAEILQETPWENLMTAPSDNGFVRSVVHAYNKHHKLQIRPDDFWMAIAVQFSLYVNGRSEELRSLFVEHEGKKQLEVKAFGTLRTVDYGELSRSMVEQLRANVKDADLCNWILPAFSTTTDNDIIAGSVVLMASMKKYFDYKFCIECGIPEITLLGTPDDWDLIKKRVQLLRKYGDDTSRWADMLQVVTENFCRTARGDIPVDFFSKICDYREGGSGPDYLSGWITAFCVFDNDGKWQKPVTGWGAKLAAESGGYLVIETDDIPAGFVTVDVLIDDNGIQRDSLMFAGHASYVKVADDTLMPKITWAIALKDKDKKPESV
jgi:uncharacterized protein DUF4419